MDNISLLDKLPLCCPKCKEKIAKYPEKYRCDTCNKDYPVMYGIPDFRLFGDPYLGFEDDYARTKLVVDNMAGLDLEGLLKFYWSNSPETPESLRSKFVRTAMLGEIKGKQVVDDISQGQDERFGKEKVVLELGCGTGGFLVQAAQKYKQVIGADIALRWLTVARKRLEQSQVEVPLICCCAEHLPLPDNFCDITVAYATLEHTRDQNEVIGETYRVLRPKGGFYINTPNRFSITAEPHVYVWGVGFLPRNWMNAYVKLIKGVEYKNKRLLSYFELKKILNRFQNVVFSLPDVDDKILEQFGSWKKFQVKIYRLIKNIKVFKAILLLFGPMYNVRGEKG